MQTSFMISCPYCWQLVAIETFESETWIEYTEDCQNCCHPILIKSCVNEFQNEVVACKENE